MTPTQMAKAVKKGKLNNVALNDGFSNPRYAYFGRQENTNKHNGVTAVGYTMSTDGKILRIAVAYCSPNDIFSKKKTQAAIIGRILWGKTEDIEATDTLFTDMRYEQIINIIKKQLNDTYFNIIGEVGCTSAKTYAKATSYTKLASFAEVNFPWWFTGI